MRLTPPLASGRLIRRYKRFLADIATPAGETFTAHCPNTGAMTGCAEPGSEVWYSRSANPRRKYACTLEVVITGQGRIGVNTGRANALVAEAIDSGWLAGFANCVIERREVAIPDEAGRFDFLLDHAGSPVYLEVKNLTLLDSAGLGMFPDTRSERAVKHVQALERRVLAGAAAALVFCVQHTGVRRVTTADAIHPEYAAAVRQAAATGVRVHAFGCRLARDEIAIDAPLPVSL